MAESLPDGINAQDHGNIVRTEDFPLSPLETWLIMRGYWVKPRQQVDVDKMLTLPGHLEMADGYIGLHNP